MSDWARREAERLAYSFLTDERAEALAILKRIVEQVEKVEDAGDFQASRRFHLFARSVVPALARAWIEELERHDLRDAPFSVCAVCNEPMPCPTVHRIYKAVKVP